MTYPYKRYAMIRATDSDTPREIAAYLPSCYKLIANWTFEHDGKEYWVLEGRDNAGWTLDDYVLPRLASGMHIGNEIGLDHPIMKKIPE